MGDIGPERVHYDVLPIAGDEPARVVELSVEPSVDLDELPDIKPVPSR